MAEKRLIMIVEDVKANRNLLSKMLIAEGYEIIEAENGQTALDIMMSGSYNISLILLDLAMPVMDGYELLAKMKTTGILDLIPVIVTTGSECDNAEIRSLECGASDFISKPYNIDIVSHRIKSILRLCDNTKLLNRLETDRLTGVYSREFFYRRVEAVLDANPDQKYDIVCSNIDNFKMINARYGVAVGDDLLRYIARQYMDLIESDGVCGRLGADSFAVLRKRSKLRTQEEIGQAYAKVFKDAPVKNFSIKYGIYQIENRDIFVPYMCDQALLALSSIKHKYGIYYAVFNDSMRKKMLREHQLSDNMKQALAENQFQIYLQPKHCVETGAVAGAEALVRWNHPELGFISPGEFIPLFERNGFISALDRMVWESACKLLKKWIDNKEPLIAISVNVSRADFLADDLPEIICNLVDSYNIPHEFFHLEVTESAYTDNPQKIIAAVSTLRIMGFLIEMDDFGSGYSSLNMLSDLPIDVLKLDMRFMQKKNGLMTDNKRSILSFIVSLSKWLQLPTVAEGVETEEEVEQLRSMGCNYIQGYFFAKPMPVAEFESYLSENNTLNSVACENKKNGSVMVNNLKAKNKPLVLIVEDIEGNRELLKELLQPYYNTEAVCDGLQAYEYIKEHHKEISCILLDLLMPVMDGFQLLDRLHKDGLFDETPIIITSESGRDSELRALHLGADSFVAKPYNSEILLHHVKKAVNEQEFRKLSKEIGSK